MTASWPACDVDELESRRPSNRRPVGLPAASDEALALGFAARHAEDVRYVAAWGRWHVWDAWRWRRDETLEVRDKVRALCREGTEACDSRREAAGVASARTVSAVERLAQADRRLAATVEQWDSDPWLLNTPRGVYDLRSGLSRPARCAA